MSRSDQEKCQAEVEQCHVEEEISKKNLESEWGRHNATKVGLVAQTSKCVILSIVWPITSCSSLAEGWRRR